MNKKPVVTRKYAPREKKEVDDRTVLIVEKNGYEYLLVECRRDDNSHPCPFGKAGFVIKCVRKIKKAKQ